MSTNESQTAHQLKKRTACYARVSTADQHSGLESQIRALKEHCERNNITDYELFTDENISGAKVSRPSLDRMMASIKKGEFSTLVVYSFSRFARSTTHLLSALEEMKKSETEFISITEKIETNSPMGRCFFTVIAAIGQLERELIVERVKNGLRNAKAKGKQIGRKKTRNSELIRSLLNTGMTFRKTAVVAGCSHGSVSLERALMRKEKAEAEKIGKEQRIKVLQITHQAEPDESSDFKPSVF
jgi:DNA invertase Pin-like site-specific DNA recombinase